MNHPSSSPYELTMRGPTNEIGGKVKQRSYALPKRKVPRTQPSHSSTSGVPSQTYIDRQALLATSPSLQRLFAKEVQNERPVSNVAYAAVLKRFLHSDVVTMAVEEEVRRAEERKHSKLLKVRKSVNGNARAHDGNLREKKGGRDRSNSFGLFQGGGNNNADHSRNNDGGDKSSSRRSSWKPPTATEQFSRIRASLQNGPPSKTNISSDEEDNIAPRRNSTFLSPQDVELLSQENETYRREQMKKMMMDSFLNSCEETAFISSSQVSFDGRASGFTAKASDARSVGKIVVGETSSNKSGEKVEQTAVAAHERRGSNCSLELGDIFEGIDDDESSCYSDSSNSSHSDSSFSSEFSRSTTKDVDAVQVEFERLSTTSTGHTADRDLDVIGGDDGTKPMRSQQQQAFEYSEYSTAPEDGCHVFWPEKSEYSAFGASSGLVNNGEELLVSFQSSLGDSNAFMPWPSARGGGRGFKTNRASAV